jgi:hypothetical protein
MDIFGIHVPSSAPVFRTFLAVHVTAAFIAVVSGAWAGFARHKGRGRHTRLGDVYFCAICVVFATATAMAVMRWREDYHLFAIGTVAFGAALTGFVARRRHWPGDATHIIGMGGSYIALLTAFYVDNGRQLPLWDRLPTFAYWLLPGLIGMPVIVRAQLRARGGCGSARRLARPGRTPR